MRELRIKNKITPVIKQIDTLAGEFSAETNYLYTTYHGTDHDVKPSASHSPPLTKRGRGGVAGAKARTSATLPNPLLEREGGPIIVLGSGPYCIGSSVEFDWCCVNTARELRKLKESPIIINSNPETVSTDYDESDRLYFEELTLERVRDIADFENPKGIIVSVGGQIPNNLARPLAQRGYKLLGTSAESIDMAEDRQKFSALLNKLDIDQPDWEQVESLDKAKAFAARLGFPLIIRPSYILSGTAMNVVWNDTELEKFLAEAAIVSTEFPAVISHFIENAKEFELDGVAEGGVIVRSVISEHVENAGIHSGDATVVIPAQRLYVETARRARMITQKIATSLNITGPFNIQFLAKNNDVKVIECNLRASRSFPFVSKVVRDNFITIATNVLMGKPVAPKIVPLPQYTGVKTPQFSYQRIKGADPVTGVEMASTGEVACLGQSYEEAFFKSWLATEQNIRGKCLLLSISGDRKIKLLEGARKLAEQGWTILATEGTHAFLESHGVGSTFVYKAEESGEPNVQSSITQGKIGLIINIPSGQGKNSATHGYKIRRLAINHHIPIITNLQIAELFITCLAHGLLDKTPASLSWQEFGSL
ncbi:MAG: ATP-grasp domain-containing protein [Candidatus Magasanikbacteria bacterium]|nr:ATP-grasp domain-containing protein [Candidatus Magasanikbacteria bacterium]